MLVRAAEVTEIDALAALWHQGWRDAHAAIVPAGLAKLRTLSSLRDRLSAALADTRVVGPLGAPLGLCMIKRDELYQLYVSEQARGAGVAAALLDDAETRIARTGVAVAWLACAIGNARAARFYEKRGWHHALTEMIELETSAGAYRLEVWRYEKRVAT
jgi:GNAT superfamily N-acetyltransferase